MPNFKSIFLCSSLQVCIIFMYLSSSRSLYVEGSKSDFIEHLSQSPKHNISIFVYNPPTQKKINRELCS